MFTQPEVAGWVRLWPLLGSLVSLLLHWLQKASALMNPIIVCAERWRGHYSEIGRNLVTLKSLQIPHPLSWWSQSLYSSFILTPNSVSLGWHSHAGPSSTVDHFCKETKLQVRSVLQLRLPLEGRLVTKVTTIPDAPEWGCFILERPPNLYSWSVSQYFNSENFMK